MPGAVPIEKSKRNKFTKIHKQVSLEATLIRDRGTRDDTSREVKNVIRMNAIISQLSNSTQIMVHIA